MKVSRSLAAVAVLSVLSATTLTACTDTTSGSTYKRGETGNAFTVYRGTVLSVREVDVKGSESGIGAGAGAAIGGVGGSQVGGNKSMNIIGAIGGALIGGLIGYAAEKGITSETALEVIVQRDDGKTVGYVQATDDKSLNLQPGQRVIIMHGEKDRVVPDTSGQPAPPPPAPAGSLSTSAPAPVASQDLNKPSWSNPTDTGAAQAITEPVKDGRK